MEKQSHYNTESFVQKPTQLELQVLLAIETLTSPTLETISQHIWGESNPKRKLVLSVMLNRMRTKGYSIYTQVIDNKRHTVYSLQPIVDVQKIPFVKSESLESVLPIFDQKYKQLYHDIDEWRRHGVISEYDLFAISKEFFDFVSLHRDNFLFISKFIDAYDKCKYLTKKPRNEDNGPVEYYMMKVLDDCLQRLNSLLSDSIGHNTETAQKEANYKEFPYYSESDKNKLKYEIIFRNNSIQLTERQLHLLEYLLYPIFDDDSITHLLSIYTYGHPVQDLRAEKNNLLKSVKLLASKFGIFASRVDGLQSELLAFRRELLLSNPILNLDWVEWEMKTLPKIIAYLESDGR